MNWLKKDGRLAWGLSGVLVLCTGLAYITSFRGAFVFDDLIHITQNDKITSLSSLLPEMARHNRPVVIFSLWANYHFGELNVFGYHLLNLGVHLAAGLLLFGLIRRTLRLPPMDRRFVQNRADWAAFAVALLWLVHPLQTQAVTYIIQRCESMMGMFFLLALYSLLRGSGSPNPGRWYVLGVAATWLGLGCKEVMITAPLVLLLYDRVFLSPSWRAVIARRWKFYLGLAPGVLWLLGLTWWRRMEYGGVSEYASQPSTLEYLSSQPAIILHYLRLVLVPDRLCFDYAWPVMHDWSAILLPGAVLLGLLLASLIALRFWPRIGFLGVAFFIVLAPTSSINPIHDLAVEHRVYLPLALMLLALVLGFAGVVRRVVARRPPRTVIYAAMLLVIASAWIVRTTVRNHVYSKPAALWANALSHAPRNARAYNNLACYLTAGGDTSGAIAHYRKAIEIDPTFALPYVNIGRNYGRQLEYDKGIAVLREGIALIPKSPMLICDLAVLLYKQGKVEDASVEFEEVLTIDSNYGRAHYWLGVVRAHQDRFDEAITHFEAALQIRPNDLGTNFRLALACQRSGRFEEAIERYSRVLELRPQFEKARKNLELCRAGNREGEPPSDEAPAKPKTSGDPPTTPQPKDRLAAGH